MCCVVLHPGSQPIAEVSGVELFLDAAAEALALSIKSEAFQVTMKTHLLFCLKIVPSKSGGQTVKPAQDDLIRYADPLQAILKTANSHLDSKLPTPTMCSKIIHKVDAMCDFKLSYGARKQDRAHLFNLDASLIILDGSPIYMYTHHTNMQCM